MCVLWWVLRWSERENTCPQILHVYGLTPVCRRMCLVSMSDLANERLHTSHMYALEPLDTPPPPPDPPLAAAAAPTPLPPSVDRDLCLEAMCLASRSLSVKVWPQMGQPYPAGAAPSTLPDATSSMSLRPTKSKLSSPSLLSISVTSQRRATYFAAALDAGLPAPCAPSEYH